MSVGSIMCSPDTSTMPRFTRPLLDLERSFDICGVFTWHSAHWKVCFPILGAYLASIYAGRQYMASRPPFHLRGALFLWNVALASFSALASWRLLTTIVYAVQTYGFLTTLCNADLFELRQATGVWMYLCILSKIVELGDTAFIVLRKTPLTFLHWYHHATVVLMVWSTGAYASPMYFYFCAINLLVHSIMYAYYALRVLGVRIPRPINMAITSLQLTQMVAGVIIATYAYNAKDAGHPCPLPTQAVLIATGIYFSYFVLFMDFFIRAYVTGKRPSAPYDGRLFAKMPLQTGGKGMANRDTGIKLAVN